jgi:hypothetical protein
VNKKLRPFLAALILAPSPADALLHCRVDGISLVNDLRAVVALVVLASERPPNVLEEPLAVTVVLRFTVDDLASCLVPACAQFDLAVAGLLMT